MKTDVQEVIKVVNLKKSYILGETKIDALRGVDFSMKKGEFTALLGSSGSGKSTLLNLLGGLDQADSGNIFLNGTDMTQLTESELDLLRNKNLGYIFQSFNLIPVLSVFENIELPLLVQKDISREVREKRILTALSDVGIERFSHYLPDKLSGGQRQRVAIARCLVMNPSLILADEPTANLDSVTAHLVIDLLKDLNQKKGVTFLFSTHDEKLIGRVSRIVHIQDGKIK